MRRNKLLPKCAVYLGEDINPYLPIDGSTRTPICMIWSAERDMCMNGIRVEPWQNVDDATKSYVLTKIGTFAPYSVKECEKVYDDMLSAKSKLT